MPETDRILFVSTLPASWGGSEYLWSQTALHLVKAAANVSVSLEFRRPEPTIISAIEVAGGQVIRRNAPEKLRPPDHYLDRAGRWITRKLFARALKPATEVHTLRDIEPGLVVISQPTCVEGIEWMLACQQLQIPYVTIAQACHDLLFCHDQFAKLLETALCGAARCYFVADANRVQLESFLARSLPHTEVVRNPFCVSYDASISWPSDNSVLRLANVARLHIPSKGQEILLQVMSLEKWRNRRVALDCFGQGPNQEGLRQLANHLKLNSVCFRGHVDGIQELWADYHALVLPSKYEGLPIALVEAMLCGRPAVVTNVSGNPEVVQDGVTGFIADAPTVASFDAAMERLWNSRTELQVMGHAAGKYIRTLVPPDPVAVFAKNLAVMVNS
jgi:glycosyltransferase involved in cell wall biosynthesis